MVDALQQSEKTSNQEAEAGEQPLATPIPSHLIDQVEVVLEASLGSCEVTLERLSKLAGGDELVLDRQINEAVELKMNGTVIGLGEIVAVDGKFGVRITQIGK